MPTSDDQRICHSIEASDGTRVADYWTDNPEPLKIEHLKFEGTREVRAYQNEKLVALVVDPR